MKRTSGQRLSVLIVDDEPVARRGLRRLLDARRDLVVIGECDNGLSAVDEIVKQRPELVLLDVQMPGIDGLEVARRVGATRMPVVVFVTAFDEFAISAFEMAATDYIVKPFSDERLMMALDRAIERRVTDRAAEELGRLLDLVAREHRPPSSDAGVNAHTVSPEAPQYRERFLVSIGRKNVVIAARDVAVIRADGYYATLVTNEGKEFLVRVPLDQLEREMDPARFLRIHRSTMVRIAEIREIERGASGSRMVVLTNGERIPISKSRREAVFQALGRGV